MSPGIVAGSQVAREPVIGHIYYVLVRVHEDLLAAESWELVVLGRVFSHFFVDFPFEFFQLGLYVLVDVPHLVQEVVVVVLLLLVFVDHVLAVLADVVYRALDHACLSHVLADGIVPVDFALRGHQRQVVQVLELVLVMNIGHICSVLQFI